VSERTIADGAAAVVDPKSAGPLIGLTVCKVHKRNICEWNDRLTDAIEIDAAHVLRLVIAEREACKHTVVRLGKVHRTTVGRPVAMKNAI
jgi:hypothetical protein